MDPSRASILVATRHHVGADLGQETILLHLTNGQYFGLGTVGARIWDLLQNPVTLGEIEAILLEEYDVDADRCHEDVLRLVRDLVAHGLVKVQGG